MATRTQEYWKKRAQQDDEQSEEDIERTLKQLKRIYREAQVAVRKDLEAFYGKYAEDNKISTTEARKRLTSGELKELKQEISDWRKRAQTTEERQYLDNLRSRVYISREEALLASLREEVTRLTYEKNTYFENGLSNVAADSQLRKMYDVDTLAGVGVSFTKLSPYQLQSIAHSGYDGTDYSEKLWYDRNKLVNEISRIVPQQFILGTPVRELSNMLANRLGVSYSSAENLLRTEASYCASRADIYTYKDIGVEKFQFIATLDSRTSEICQDMDLKTFPMKEAQPGVNMPPLHNRCRSTTVPDVDISDITDDPERLAKNADGSYVYVPANMSYPEYKQYLQNSINASDQAMFGNVPWTDLHGQDLKGAMALITAGNPTIPRFEDIANATPEALAKMRDSAYHAFRNSYNGLQKEVSNRTENYEQWSPKQREASDKKLKDYAEKCELQNARMRAADAVKEGKPLNGPKAVATDARDIARKAPVGRITPPAASPQSSAAQLIDEEAFQQAFLAHTPTNTKELSAAMKSLGITFDNKIPDWASKGFAESIMDMSFVDSRAARMALANVKNVHLATAAETAKQPKAFAYYDNGNGHLVLGSKYFGASSKYLLQASYERTTNNGFHPKNTTWESLITHELGHAADAGWGKYIAKSDKWANFHGRRWSNENLNTLYEITQNKGVAGWDKVSKYGTANLQEAFAESFADYMKNDERAHPYSIRLIEKFLDDLEEANLK